MFWNAIDTQLLAVWNLKRISQIEVSITDKLCCVTPVNCIDWTTEEFIV